MTNLLILKFSARIHYQIMKSSQQSYKIARQMVELMVGTATKCLSIYRPEKWSKFQTVWKWASTPTPKSSLATWKTWRQWENQRTLSPKDFTKHTRNYSSVYAQLWVLLLDKCPPKQTSIQSMNEHYYYCYYYYYYCFYYYYYYYYYCIVLYCVCVCYYYYYLISNI